MLRNLLFVGVLVAVVAPVAYFVPRPAGTADDPWAQMPARPIHTDHSDLMAGPFEDGPAVTRACLECHEDVDTETGVYVPELEGYCHEWCEELLGEDEDEW